MSKNMSMRQYYKNMVSNVVLLIFKMMFKLIRDMNNYKKIFV